MTSSARVLPTGGRAGGHCYPRAVAQMIIRSRLTWLVLASVLFLGAGAPAQAAKRRVPFGLFGAEIGQRHYAAPASGLHLALVANILNAVGGRPRLDYPSMLPAHPRPMPHGDRSLQLSTADDDPYAIGAGRSDERGP